MHQPQRYPLDRDAVEPPIRKAAMSAGSRLWLAIAAPVFLFPSLFHFVQTSLTIHFPCKSGTYIRCCPVNKGRIRHHGAQIPTSDVTRLITRVKFCNCQQLHRRQTGFQGMSVRMAGTIRPGGRIAHRIWFHGGLHWQSNRARWQHRDGREHR